MINIIIPTYQSAKWLPLCINIIKLQTHKDFRCVFIDDCSEDFSADIIDSHIRSDSRFSLLCNNYRTGSSLGNYIKGFDFLNPHDNDIIVWIDGDDWLSDTFVLNDLKKIYDSVGCWMTYGSWKVYPTGEVLDWESRIFPDEVHKERSYRQYPHYATHIRTHYAFLFNKIDRSDLIDPRSNQYWTEANDTAYLFPMLEMCGSRERIHLNKQVYYILNRENPLNEAKVKLHKQKTTESLIRNKRKYDQL